MSTEKKSVPKSASIDICITTDTTGSIASALGQIRKSITDTVNYLFDEVPELRIAFISHGDYFDGADCINKLDFTSDKQKIIDAVNSFPYTCGGDSDECYELVLNEVRKLDWSAGKNKALVMIGDANPHAVGYRHENIVNKLDWQNEAKLLVEAGIEIHPIHVFDSSSSAKFYNTLATLSKTNKLTLNQFADINQILTSVVMHRANKLEKYQEKLAKTSISWGVVDTINRLGGSTKIKFTKKKDVNSVSPSRFQVFNVEKDCSIKDFVQKNGLVFKIGRGFYEFTKPVTVQAYKEVVVQDKINGDMFNGDEARKKLGIPLGRSSKVAPEKFNRDWRGFIQSTSANRKLLGGTKFMYEVVD